MGVYYPQSSMTLRILWEDFDLKSKANLQKVYVVPIMAKSVTVYINDYTSADTFEAEIDFKNFPFDPRMIRACGVTIHMEDVKQVFQRDNALKAIARTTDNTVFEGYVDEESITFDDSKRTVKFEGRDLTALLIDRKYLGGPLPLTDALVTVLQNVLNSLDETATSVDVSKGLKLDVRGLSDDEKNLVLAKFYNKEGDHQLNGHMNVDRDQNYWEVIQDVVARAGLIAFVELDKLVLTKPRALYSGVHLSKVFVYGKNVKNLTLKRKLGRKKTFNVIVRSVLGKEVVDAKIPAEATEDWVKATGIQQGEVKMPEVGPKGEPIDPKMWKAAPYMSFRIPDCGSKEQLIRYAQEVYEEVSRQQIEGSFDTKEMTTQTLGGAVTDINGKVSFAQPEDFNILKIRNGTPIQLLIDQGDMKGLSRLTNPDKDTQRSMRINYMENRGYDPAISAAFADSMDQFANVFYTKAIRYTLSHEDGFKAAIEFLNFIDTKRVKVPELPPAAPPTYNNPSISNGRVP